MTTLRKHPDRPNRWPDLKWVAAPVCAALVGVAATFWSLPPAAAQDASYSADDVTRHFQQMKTRSFKPAGGTRALCIGTRDECDASNPDAAGSGGQVAVTSDPGDGTTQAPDGAAVGEGFNLLVSFEYASARLSPIAQTNLREFAKGISVDGLEAATFIIEGHTDGIGSAAYNQRLSEDRARAVTDFLISQGIDDDRLKTVGYGKSRPKTADVNDPANRRVESRLIFQ